MNKKGLLMLVLTSSFFLSAILPAKFFNEKEGMILNAVINYLEALHFKPVELDDSFSNKAFDNYIQMIDPSKRFLLQSEVDQMAEYKDLIDDQVKMRDFSFFEESIDIIDESRERAKSIYDKVIVSDFDAILGGDLEMDRDKRTFANSEIELTKLWTKIMKYDYNNRLRNKIKSQEETLKKREAKKEKGEELDEDFEMKSEDKMKEEVVEAIKKSYDTWFKNMDKDRRSDKFETYVNSITHLFDPHSDYLNPKEKEDFDIRMGGKLEGIGARLSTQDDMTKVVSIIAGGPAWKGKELQVDDLITAVAQKGEDAIDVVGMRLDDVVQKIRGDKGTVVILTVKKPDGSVVEIEIERDEVIIDDAFAKSLILDLPDAIDNVGYIRLPKFYSSFENEGGNSCAKDVKLEIEKLKEKDVNAIILDLRNNGGGSLKDVVDMTGLFIEEGPIVQVKPRGREAYVYEDEDSEVHYEGPLVVMVNQFSASASEILAAALQDYDRAVIVGSNSTFGKGTVQRFVDLDRAYRDIEEIKPLGNLKITMQKFYRVNGGSTQLKGVVPDIILPDNYHFIETGEKDYDNAMDWSEIEPVEFGQDVYVVNNIDKLIKKSNKRIAKHNDFNLLLENAQRIKENKDFSVYPLSNIEYNAFLDKRDEEAKKFDDLFEEDIENFEVSNLEADMQDINLDESTIERNKEWLEGVKKDIYLQEVGYIIRDMIKQDKSFTSANIPKEK